MSTVLPPSVADSPLFRLPPELRNQIYAYAVRTEPRIVTVDWANTNLPDLPAIYCGRYSASAPALLTVCRTIYNEAIGEFCALPQYSIVVSVQLGQPTAMSFWDGKIRDLLSQYAVKHDIGKPESDVDDYEQWLNLTEWLRDAQEALVSGKPHPSSNSSEGNPSGRFEYFIEKRQ